MDPERWNSRFRCLHQAQHIGDRCLQRGGEEGARGGGSSPRSSNPSLNWPLSLIRGCLSSSGCAEELGGAGLGAGAAVEGAWPRGGGRGTPGPGGLRRSLPGAGSMAPGLQIPRGEADHDGDRSPKCQGRRARRESFTPTAVSGKSAASSACGGGWGRAVAAALRPRGQVRAAGTRPEALSPGTGIDALRRLEREGPGRSRRAEAEGTVRGRGDQPEPSAGLGEGVTEDAPPTHVSDWCPRGTPPP